MSDEVCTIFDLQDAMRPPAPKDNRMTGLSPDDRKLLLRAAGSLRAFAHTLYGGSQKALLRKQPLETADALEALATRDTP